MPVAEVGGTKDQRPASVLATSHLAAWYCHPRPLPPCSGVFRTACRVSRCVPCRPLICHMPRLRVTPASFSHCPSCDTLEVVYMADMSRVASLAQLESLNVEDFLVRVVRPGTGQREPTAGLFHASQSSAPSPLPLTERDLHTPHAEPFFSCSRPTLSNPPLSSLPLSFLRRRNDAHCCHALALCWLSKLTD